MKISGVCKDILKYISNISKVCIPYYNILQIVKEFSLSYKNTRKNETTFVFPWDPTGKSNIRYVEFTFDSGDAITVSCYKYKKSIKMKNNWIDNLSISISKKEVLDWMRKHIN